MVKVYDTDVLVIGGGAGARAAIGANEAGADVILVDKGIFGKAGITALSFGIVCSYIVPPDSGDVLAEDMIRAGQLNNQKLVEAFSKLIADGTILELEGKYGLVFDRDEKGRLSQKKMGGHSYARDLIVTWNDAPCIWRGVIGDFTKRGINLLNEVMITNLLTYDGNCVGALGLDVRTGEFIVFRAKTTVFGTGGIGQLYEFNDNARGSTGDGVAMAYRAGAELRDMEYVQFMLGFAWPPALAGIGIGEPALVDGKLYNVKKERFMEDEEATPKDVHCREVIREIREGRGTEHEGIWFDLTKMGEKKQTGTKVGETRQPHYYYLYPMCARVGIDLSKEYAEATSVEHYHMGGIYINENQESTTIPGLFAVGENSSGLHGTERLAGCSVADITVMGYRGGQMAAQKALKIKDKQPIDWDQVATYQRNILSTLERKVPLNSIRPPQIRKIIQKVMWENAHLIRDEKGLNTALKEIRRIREEDLPRMEVASDSKVFNYDWIEALETLNMVDVAELILLSALERNETRGAHNRKDYPNRDDKNWLKNIVINCKDGKMNITTRAPVTTRWKVPLGE